MNGQAIIKLEDAPSRVPKERHYRGTSTQYRVAFTGWKRFVKLCRMLTKTKIPYRVRFFQFSKLLIVVVKWGSHR